MLVGITAFINALSDFKSVSTNYKLSISVHSLIDISFHISDDLNIVVRQSNRRYESPILIIIFSQTAVKDGYGLFHTAALSYLLLL